tara:strand:- start:112 stop:1041 length:930 start_codon:yes stop_codon:yes gene_type:complete
MNIDVRISEVGLRDGLQSIASIMSSDDKKSWIEGASKAGIPEIEIGSFVSAKLIPQLADTAELAKFASSLPGLTVVALVPNRRGLENAITAGVHGVSIPFSMSETHSQNNLRKNHSQMLDEIKNCLDYLSVTATDERPTFTVGLATAFGCSMEGEVPEDRVLHFAERLTEMGVDEVALSDTTGYGNPAQLKRLVQGIWHHCGKDKLTSVHLHNTRGQGLANALMAVELGIDTIDSSLGGLGGCPFAPGASGNIVTEDLVFMLESMGLRTGINLEALIDVRKIVAQALPNEKLYGFTAEAGLPLNYSAAK